jgi:predicted nucleic acid-binding protein
MTTAIDTNVLVTFFRDAGTTAEESFAALRHAGAQGPLVVSAPVYAEILAAPGSSMEAIDSFLAEGGIAVDWRIDEAVWRAAAHAYRGCAERRRAQRGDPGPRRILTDFLIGAHATLYASALLTFDQSVYRAAFPTLTIIRPGSGNAPAQGSH